MRRGTGGVDGTKAKQRLPYVPVIAPHFPELDHPLVTAIIKGSKPLPNHLSVSKKHV